MSKEDKIEKLNVFWGYPSGRKVWVQCGHIKITEKGAYFKMFAMPVDPYFDGLLSVRHADWKKKKAAGEYNDELPDRKFNLMFGTELDKGTVWRNCGMFIFRGSGNHTLVLKTLPVGEDWNGQFVLREVIEGQEETLPANYDSMYPSQAAGSEVKG